MGRVNKQWTAPIMVGDRVRVREEGDSAAARKYSGRHGQVTDIAIGATKATIFVCVEGNHALQTAFEERDILKLEEQEGSPFVAAAQGRGRSVH
jgi:hypothetical protein